MPIDTTFPEEEANRLATIEVGLTGIGNFNFVRVKHKPLSTVVEDLAERVVFLKTLRYNAYVR